jgi:hypothetical protein
MREIAMVGLQEPVGSSSFRPQLRCTRLPAVLAQQNHRRSASGDRPNRGGADLRHQIRQHRISAGHWVRITPWAPLTSPSCSGPPSGQRVQASRAPLDGELADQPRARSPPYPRPTETAKPDCQPTRSDTGIMQAAALSGQIHPSARTNASRVTVQIISTR